MAKPCQLQQSITANEAALSYLLIALNANVERFKEFTQFCSDVVRQAADKVTHTRPLERSNGLNMTILCSRCG